MFGSFSVGRFLSILIFSILYSDLYVPSVVHAYIVVNPVSSNIIGDDSSYFSPSSAKYPLSPVSPVIIPCTNLYLISPSPCNVIVIFPLSMLYHPAPFASLSFLIIGATNLSFTLSTYTHAVLTFPLSVVALTLYQPVPISSTLKLTSPSGFSIVPFISFLYISSSFAIFPSLTVASANIDATLV